MDLICSFILRMGGNPAEASSSGQTGDESNSLAVVVHRVAPGEPPYPLDKGKGKINKIRYPSGSEYFRAAIHNARAMVPNQVEPLYGEIFATGYGPPFGIQVWCPDELKSHLFLVHFYV